MNEASQQLAKEMKDAQLAQFGPDPGRATYPTEFFLQDVRVYQGDPTGPTSQPVSPSYCASNFGAAEISAVLSGAVATEFLCPLNPAGLEFGWKTTANVPYLIFERNGQKGKPINAAFLLDYYTHGYPADLALSMAQAEVDGSFA